MSQTTDHCPKCGKKNELIPAPGKPGRVVMNCNCNPSGPVLETDAVKAEPANQKPSGGK